jgi:periplasmic glucans biosynthesis protein
MAATVRYIILFFVGQSSRPDYPMIEIFVITTMLKKLIPCVALLLVATLPGTVQAQPFSLEQLSARAQMLAKQPYQKPVSNLPPVFSSMQFADYMKIQPRSEKFEWQGLPTPFKLAFYHQGMQFNSPVLIHEIVGPDVQDIPYSPDRFNFGDLAFDRQVTSRLGYAGFRVLYPVNKPGKDDEVMSILGASYFRVIGKDQIYGLSARGLALDTAMASGEEFPHFSEFWIQRPAADDRQVTFYALLDSPRATGAYKFILTPGEDALLDVQARVFLRGDVTRLGIAPLTSMFLFGPNQQSSRRNFRPAIHDSNGLAIHTGSGEWLWRPLNDPQNVQVSSFAVAHPKGFGLLQRGRAFSNFEDLKDRYDLRPSAWIEPKGDWGHGVVQLVEIPTADETNDNIVAYWLPAQLPPKGQALQFDYRIHWTMNEAALLEQEVGWVKNTFHTDGERTQANLIRHADGTTALLVDFTGPVLSRLAPDTQVRPQVSISGNGELLDAQLQPNPAIGGWRLSLRVKVKNLAEATELRAALVSGERTLTETWSYQLPPHSEVQRAF